MISVPAGICIHHANKAPLATEAIGKIGALFDVEHTAKGKSPAVVCRLTARIISSPVPTTATRFYTPIETAKLHRLDPQAYLRCVLDHNGEHPINRIDELLPWNIGAAECKAAV